MSPRRHEHAPGHTPADGLALTVRGLSAGHGLLKAVIDVDLSVPAGQVLALVGANGAGKTTLLRTLAGAHTATAGTVTLGSIDITKLPAHKRSRLGVALVPEGRRLFPELTVAENLAVARATGRSGEWTVETALAAFPQLSGLDKRPAARLSGGQQQAVAIARALVTNPAVLLLDEVSLGLSPTAVDGVYASLAALKSSGVTIVVVEQDLRRAMNFADRLICMLEGRVVLSGGCEELTREQVTDAYFGMRDHPPADHLAGSPSEATAPEPAPEVSP